VSGYWASVENAFWYILSAVIAIGLWVARNILTNGKRLDLLEQQAKHHSALRKADHEAISEVRRDVGEIKNHLMK